MHNQMLHTIAGVTSAVLYIALFALFIRLKGKYRRESFSESDIHYRICQPGVTHAVCIVMYLLLTGMFLFVLVSYFVGDADIPARYLYGIASASGMAIFAALWYQAWCVTVSDDTVMIQTLGAKPCTTRFSDIQDIQISSRENWEGVVLYGANGKKLVFVDALCQNYERLWTSLKKYKKV